MCNHLRSASCSHPGQEQIHLQLSHAPAQTRPDPKAERHRAERVPGLLLGPSEPPLRQEGVRVGEDPLIVGHGVVAQVKQRLCDEILVKLLQLRSQRLHKAHTLVSL